MFIDETSYFWEENRNNWLNYLPWWPYQYLSRPIICILNLHYHELSHHVALLQLFVTEWLFCSLVISAVNTWQLLSIYIYLLAMQTYVCCFIWNRSKEAHINTAHDKVSKIKYVSRIFLSLHFKANCQKELSCICGWFYFSCSC